jgi:hypothetical protein
MLEKVFLSTVPAKEKRPEPLTEKLLRDKQAALIRSYSHLKALERKLTRQERILSEEIGKRDREIETHKHAVNLKQDELNSIYHSKQWKIAEAIKESRHSFKAFVKLPARIIRHMF